MRTWELKGKTVEQAIEVGNAYFQRNYVKAPGISAKQSLLCNNYNGLFIQKYALQPGG